MTEGGRTPRQPVSSRVARIPTRALCGSSPGPLPRGWEGAQPSFSLIRRLSELRPRTPSGPGMWLMWMVLPAMSATDPASLVDRHHLLRADIDRPGEVRAHQPRRALEAFVDIEERAGLLAVAPDLDLAAARELRPPCGRWRPAPFPCRRPRCLPGRRCCGSAPRGFPCRGCGCRRDTAARRTASPSRIRCRARPDRPSPPSILGCPGLPGCRPGTCRPRRNRKSAVARACDTPRHVEVDGGRVVHDVGVVLAGEDVAGAAHVGRELIDLVEAAVDHDAQRSGRAGRRSRSRRLRFR